MKLKEKTKYVAIGAFSMILGIPAVIKATDAIPLTFSQGDILSAEVLNTIFTRINQATSPLTADDLLGTWAITQYMPYNGQPGNGTCRTGGGGCTITGTTDSADQLTRYRTGTATFTKSGSTYSFTTSGIAAFATAASNSNESGNFTVIAETVVFKEGIQQAFFVGRKKSATTVVLQDMQPASNSFNLVFLTKQNVAPLPASNLVANTSGTTVALTWADQSSDETGFKVQTKTSVGGSWRTLDTTAANATSYSATAASGNNWYRVIATNSSGDSITSNELLVEVQ